jgi:hypothetical protein
MLSSVRPVSRSLPLRRFLAGALVFGLAAGAWVGPMAAPAAANGQAVSNVVAWGDNTGGKTTVPTSLSGASITAVAGGDNHSLALKADGTVAAWARPRLRPACRTWSPSPRARSTAWP